MRHFNNKQTPKMKIKFCICGMQMTDRKFFYTSNILDMLMLLAQIAAASYSLIFQINFKFIAYIIITFIYFCFLMGVTVKTFSKMTRLDTKRNKISSHVKIIAYLVSFFGKSFNFFLTC